MEVQESKPTEAGLKKQRFKHSGVFSRSQPQVLLASGEQIQKRVQVFRAWLLVTTFGSSLGFDALHGGVQGAVGQAQGKFVSGLNLGPGLDDFPVRRGR